MHGTGKPSSITWDMTFWWHRYFLTCGPLCNSGFQYLQVQHFLVQSLSFLSCSRRGVQWCFMLSALHLPCPFQVLIEAVDHECFSQLLRMKSVMLVGWNLVVFPSSKNWEFFLISLLYSFTRVFIFCLVVKVLTRDCSLICALVSSRESLIFGWGSSPDLR